MAPEEHDRIVPGEGCQLPGVHGLVEAEHDEAEAPVIAPLVEEGPQAPVQSAAMGMSAPASAPNRL